MQALEDIGTRRNFNTVKQKVTVEKHANKFLLENPCNGKTRFDDPLEDDISCDILGTFTDYVQKHTKVNKFNPCNQYVSVFKNMLGTNFLIKFKNGVNITQHSGVMRFSTAFLCNFNKIYFHLM